MKTYRQLKIKKWEHEALLAVRELLDDKKLQHTHYQSSHALKKPGFNMDTTARQYDCGTVACVGGWMSLFEQAGFQKKYTPEQFSVADDYVSDWRSAALHELFYPGYDSTGSRLALNAFISFSKIKQHHAVKAIDNFLETGHPDWAELVGEKDSEA
jgi:hypothetical protein